MQQLRGIFSSLAIFLVACIAFEAHAQKSGVATNVLALPKGPGSIGGVGENVQANLNMGLMSYAIKVALPGGRKGMAPALAITYSSSAGAGLMGIGWSLGAGGSVKRLTVRGLPTYTNEDRFYAGGELVKIPSSPFYRARMEGGFSRYRWVQPSQDDQRGYWLAEHPNGSKSYYGANSKGKIDLNAQIYGLDGTFQWELVTEVDRNGNRIEYTYTKDGSQTYIDSISWVFDKQNNPLYRVTFTYEARPDYISDGKPGFDLQTKKRISELKITSAGTPFRSYQFTYEDATGLSRLTQVRRYGRDGKSLYPVKFDMKYSDATFSAANTRLVTIPTPLGVNFATGNIGFIDINGDGLPDVVDSSQSKHIFHLNGLQIGADLKRKAHDFAKKVENPFETSAQLKSPSVQMLDINGDGFTDLVDAVNKKIYLNKGNGQWENGGQSLQNFPVTGNDPNMRFIDYDGDKKIDVISSDGSTTNFWINDGNGGWKVVAGKVNIGLGFSKDGLKLIDMNGDGLQDVVHITKDSLRYRKYLGYGKWTGWIDVKVPGIDQNDLSQKAEFQDINGDGLADMVAFFGNSMRYFVNKNGTEFTAGQDLQKIDGIELPNSDTATARLVDINGNGSRDIVWINSSGKVVYLELFDKRPNLMTEISNGIGQRINVTYGSSVNFYLRDQSCNVGQDVACEGPWQNKLPMPFTVVTQIMTWASHSDDPASQKSPSQDAAPIVQQIYYHNGFYDGKEKKFRGFRKVENVEVGDSSIPSKHSFIEFDVGDSDPYMHGKTLRTIVKDPQGQTFYESKVEWKECAPLAGVDKDLNPAVRYICLAAQEQTFKEGLTDTSKWKTTRSEFTYDGYGNMILSTQLGEKDKSGDELYQKRTYIVPSDPKALDSLWNIRMVQQAQHCEKRDGDCITYLYHYDGEAFEGLPIGQLTKGNLSRIVLKGGDKDDIIPTRRKYDEYGNVIESLGTSGQRRTTEWDQQYGLFAVKETVHIGKRSISASVLWDYSNSVVTQSTDFNGHVTRYTYDAFGRLSARFQPGDPDDKPLVKYSYIIKAPLSQLITETRSQVGGDLDRKRIDCFDGLGRMINQRIMVAEGRYTILHHKAFNSRGQVTKRWRAYESDAACSFAPKSDVAVTTYQFDALGRNSKTTYPDGSTSRMEYEPFKTIAFDQNDTDPDSAHYNTPTTEIVDGLGRTISTIRRPSKDQELISRFEYSSLNAQTRHLVTKQIFPDGSIKLHEYDLRGFVTKVTDPDRSTIEYTYDTDGNLLQRKDARGRILVYTYDEIGRILTRQEKDKADTRVTFTYDLPVPGMPDARNLKGRAVSVTYPGGAAYYSYSDKGAQILTRHLIMGVQFDIKRSFNNTGDLQKLTFPDGRELTYTYDRSGRLLTIPGVVKGITYQPTGPIDTRTMANGVKTSYQVDNRDRVTGINVSGDSGFSFQLGYDNVGNILNTTEVYAGKSHQNHYQHDALYRLTRAALNDDREILQFKLDNQHNITSKTSSLGDKSPVHIGDFKYDATKIHAATQAGAIKMAYDKAGHMSICGKMGMEWDAEGRLTSLSVDGQKRGRFWYNQGMGRIAKVEDGLHSFYPSKAFRIQDGTISLYVTMGNHLIAEWRSSKGLASFYDDLAPAKGDGIINVADAWAYHAAKQGFGKAELKKRPVDLDLTRDMLVASAERLLTDGKDEKFFLHTDHLGSIRMITDGDGKTVGYKRYYPYGSIQVQEGMTYALGFQGTEQDNVSHANYFGARYLDARLGKWLSPDPAFEKIKGTNDEWNSYASVSNNPLRYRDANGFVSVESSDWTAIAAGSLVLGIGSVLVGFQAGGLRSNAASSGKISTTSRSLLIAGSVATMALSSAATAMAVMDDPQTAGILSFAATAVSTARSTLGILTTHRKHLKIKKYTGSYSKDNHRRGIRFQSVTAVMSVGRAAMSAYAAFGNPDPTTQSILSAASMVSALIGVVAAMKGTASVTSNGKFSSVFSTQRNFYKQAMQAKRQNVAAPLTTNLPTGATAQSYAPGQTGSSKAATRHSMSRSRSVSMSHSYQKRR